MDDSRPPTGSHIGEDLRGYGCSQQVNLLTRSRSPALAVISGRGHLETNLAIIARVAQAQLDNAWIGKFRQWIGRGPAFLD